MYIYVLYTITFLQTHLAIFLKSKWPAANVISKTPDFWHFSKDIILKIPICSSYFSNCKFMLLMKGRP